ncbi:acyl-CoA dehydrogenase family protein [Aeromicrobium panaciterrae]|uniref:acyl-CoA dehydrogenase family protein n=1 Tax=Aeromicrobium panaciterrae TaxID=363861 RepID=UPI0031E42876
MSWDFETEPEFQAKLDWIDAFVRDEIEPLELLGEFHPADKSSSATTTLIRGLQDQVKAQGLWACHLGPELGGQGYGQVKLALMNEIVGRSQWAPYVFGSQAPDSGNAEILAHFGTDEQKATYLQPLLDGEISSCYSMTEPQVSGSDPTLQKTTAILDGAEWVVNGEKWFQTNAQYADFFIVMAVTEPDVEDPYRRMSLVIVPAETPGVEFVRHLEVAGEGSARTSHSYLKFTDVRVPAANLLGERGGAFAIAQTRLGGGRIHHAMRAIGRARQAFDMLCERAVSRDVRQGRLSGMQMTQEKIADSWIEIEQFRLLVLRTAWLIDRHQDYKMVRKDISAVKVAMPAVLHNVAQRAMHLHGALGVSDELPLASMAHIAEVMGIVDGPTEVHKILLARELLKNYTPVEGPWPTAHIPTRREAAREKYAELLEHQVASQ